MAATKNEVKKIITIGDKGSIDKLLSTQKLRRHQKSADILLIAAEYGAEETFRYIFTQTNVKRLTSSQRQNILAKVVNREPLQSDTLLQLLTNFDYRQYFVLHMKTLSTKPAAKAAIEKVISFYTKPGSRETLTKEIITKAAKAALHAGCLDIAFLWLKYFLILWGIEESLFKLIATKGSLDFIKNVLSLPSWELTRDPVISEHTTLALFTDDPEKHAYLFGYIQKYRKLDKSWLEPVMKAGLWKEKHPNFLNTLLQKDIDTVSIFEAILERGKMSEAIMMLQHPNLQNHAEALLLSALQTSMNQQEKRLAKIATLPTYANILSNPPQAICKRLLCASEEVVKKRLERYPTLREQAHHGLFIPTQEIVPYRNNIGFLLNMPSVQAWIKQNKPESLVNTVIATLDVRLLHLVKNLLGNDGLARQHFEGSTLIQLISHSSNSLFNIPTLLKEAVKIPSFLEYIAENENTSAQQNDPSYISLGFEEACQKLGVSKEKELPAIEESIKVLASIPELIEASAFDWIFREDRFVSAHTSQIHTNRKALLKVISGLIFRRSFKHLNYISRRDSLIVSLCKIINQGPENNQLSAFLEVTQTLVCYGQPDAIKRIWVSARHMTQPGHGAVKHWVTPHHKPSSIDIDAAVTSYSQELLLLVQVLNRKFGFYTEKTKKKAFTEILKLISATPEKIHQLRLVDALKSALVLPEWKQALSKRLFQLYCFEPFQIEITNFVGKDHIQAFLRKSPQVRNFSAIIFWFQSAANRGKIANLPIEIWRYIWEKVLTQDTWLKNTDKMLTKAHEKSLLNFKPITRRLFSSNVPKPKEAQTEEIAQNHKKPRIG